MGKLHIIFSVKINSNLKSDND
ncbi:protein of unknown function [Methanoculleus bourgensis]|uniref:Uncharacterized protein n=1 Tax=Methanoculleus bourgensis TaxID=83986 RepID=A0A0X3BH36_9EURY|nr:protein of unknown function [Methanoculleus bourgensis]